MPVELSIFCGNVVATDHTEEVSGASMHGNGYIWTDVHRELWIRQHDGLERRFSFTNIDLPARQGHHVALLLDGARPVALINFSTEQYVNLEPSTNLSSSVRRRHLRLRHCSSLPVSLRLLASPRCY